MCRVLRFRFSFHLRAAVQNTAYAAPLSTMTENTSTTRIARTPPYPTGRISRRNALIALGDEVAMIREVYREDCGRRGKARLERVRIVR